MSASTLGRLPAETIHPRAAPVVRNARLDAWIRHGAQEQAWRRRKGAPTRSGGKVLCRGLEQLRVNESEYERRCMVEYEYAMYDLYHPDLSCL